MAGKVSEVVACAPDEMEVDVMVVDEVALVEIVVDVEKLGPGMISPSLFKKTPCPASQQLG